ncbi:MAG: hypothetical protein HWN68_16065 [Desulfobacterales bacterium]|nr:hypothetical protein [Desulfobacterales bacterium]
MTKKETTLKDWINVTVILQILICLAVAIPIAVPIGLPVPITEYTRNVYNIVESIEPGSVVLFTNEVSAGGWGEMASPTTAVMQHLFKRPVKIVFVEFFEDSPILTEMALDKIDKGDKVYGVDYVHLGFVPGYGTAVAMFAKSVWTAFPVDYHGTPLEELPLMADIEDASDFEIQIEAQTVPAVGPVDMLQHIHSPYEVPFVVIATAVAAPGHMAYVESGDISGITIGVKGGAEYEILIKRLGAGAATMDAMSISHLLLIIVLIVGNIIYFTKRRGP